MHNDRSALDQLFSLYLQLATYPPQGTVHTYLAYLPTYYLAYRVPAYPGPRPTAAFSIQPSFVSREHCMALTGKSTVLPVLLAAFTSVHLPYWAHRLPSPSPPTPLNLPKSSILASMYYGYSRPPPLLYTYVTASFLTAMQVEHSLDSLAGILIT
jgi:hypothetical protein